MMPLFQTARQRQSAPRVHELETARLRLRVFTPDDIGELARITRDPEVMRYIGDGRPLTWEETDYNLSTIIRAFRRRGFGRWAMVHKAGGRLLGYCGFSALSFDEVGIELAYMLARPYWGMGLASEAARACVRYAFEVLGLDSLAALTMPGNARSRQLLEKLGMRHERDLRLHGYDCVLYRIRREEFRPDGSLYLAKPVLLPPSGETD
jgi:RimJ/RimL family protein N-acetyltransferase